jgi:hypothetical protein
MGRRLGRAPRFQFSGQREHAIAKAKRGEIDRGQRDHGITTGG